MIHRAGDMVSWAVALKLPRRIATRSRRRPRRALAQATRAVLLLVGLTSSFAANALQARDIVGTWRLVSSTRKVVATGEVSDTYGPHPTGWIMYGRDGRMMVLIVHGPRPRPASIATMTAAEKAGLFATMLAYAGTYEIKGDTIVHAIDASWNELWTGTRTVRDVALHGDELVYTTKPAPASSDGKVSVVTLIWHRVGAEAAP